MEAPPARRKFKQTKPKRLYFKDKARERRDKLKNEGLREVKFPIPIEYLAEIKTKIKEIIAYYLTLRKEKQNDGSTTNGSHKEASPELSKDDNEKETKE